VPATATTVLGAAALSEVLPLDRLTSRERTIVTLAASGLSNREIAQRLYVATASPSGATTATSAGSPPPARLLHLVFYGLRDGEIRCLARNAS
jgi:Bacterial regulatory proteins, luxR family